MSSWNDLFVYNEAGKKGESDPFAQKNEFSEDLQSDQEELDSEADSAEFDQMNQDFDTEEEQELMGDPEDPAATLPGMNDETGMEGEMGAEGEMGMEDPEGQEFDSMDNEISQMTPDEKERKAYLYKILVRVINTAERVSKQFVLDGEIPDTCKEIEQINMLVELLTYYKTYKYDTITDLDEIEKLLKKSVKSVDTISKKIIALKKRAQNK